MNLKMKNSNQAIIFMDLSTEVNAEISICFVA